jgi:hypothetical protein
MNSLRGCRHPAGPPEPHVGPAAVRPSLSPVTNRRTGPALPLDLREVPDPPVFPWGGLSLDVDDRRRRVLQFRLAGASQARTAAVLHVGQATVSRDLAYWRHHPPVSDALPEAAVFIGETIAFCEEMRGIALRDHDRLSVDPAAAGARGTSARVECLRVAMAAQGLQIRVLKAAGLLVVGAAQQPPQEMTANAIALRLKALGVVPEARLSQPCRSGPSPGSQRGGGPV